jgi:hypothetical protein
LIVVPSDRFLLDCYGVNVRARRDFQNQVFSQRLPALVQPMGWTTLSMLLTIAIPRVQVRHALRMRMAETTDMNSKNLGPSLALLTMGISGTALADPSWTGTHRISVVDSVAAGFKYVTLEGYTNASCDLNRILLESTDAEYRREMFAMALSAMHAGSTVQLLFDVSGGQCRASRILVYAS